MSSNTATTSAQAVSMVAPWEKHLTIAGREPHSLFERGLAQAEYDHRTRVEELVSMQDKLAQLDKLLPELNARGLMLQNRMLRIYCNGVVGMGSIGTPDDAAYAAMLASGFTEVFRKPYYPGASTDTVHILYGEKLMIGMEVSRLEAQRVGKHQGLKLHSSILRTMPDYLAREAKAIGASYDADSIEHGDIA